MKTILSFAALLLSGATLFAQAERTFETKYQAGKTWTITSTRVLDLDLTVTDLENQKTGRQVKADVQEKYEREFQKVEAGRPSQVRVKVLEDRHKSKPGPLEGMEIVIDGSGANGAGLTPEQTGSFRLEEDFEAILPGKAVAVGAKWSLNHRDVAKFVLDTFSIAPGAEGSGACTLLAIQKVGDREVAQVQVDLDLKGTSSTGWELRASVSGTLTYDLTNGRPEKLDLHGELRASGEEKDDKKQVVATVEGRGILTIINTYEAR